MWVIFQKSNLEAATEVIVSCDLQDCYISKSKITFELPRKDAKIMLWPMKKIF